MPRKSRAIGPEVETPEATPVEAAAELPRGVKAQAIRDALNANPGKEPREIVALLKEQGLEVTNAAVSMAKFNMKEKRKKKTKTKHAKAAPAPAPAAAAAPALPKDAVSLALLQKAKKLVAQLGSIKEAKAAIDALAQLMD